MHDLLNIFLSFTFNKQLDSILDKYEFRRKMHKVVEEWAKPLNIYSPTFMNFLSWRGNLNDPELPAINELSEIFEKKGIPSVGDWLTALEERYLILKSNNEPDSTHKFFLREVGNSELKSQLTNLARGFHKVCRENKELYERTLLNLNEEQYKLLSEIKSQLNKNATGLPVGISEIDKALKDFKKYSYKKFLVESHYISRQEFYIKQGMENEERYTESYVLDRLLDINGNYIYCIIYGQGGFGKTKLTYELGKIAKSNEWYVVSLEIDKLNFEQIQNFVANSKESHIILLIDYLEKINGKLPFDFAISLNDHFKNKTIRVIGNCRSNYYQWSEFKEIDSNILFPWNLDNETRYQNYVTGRLLEKVIQKIHNRFKYPNQLIDFGKINASYAIFLIIMDQNGQLDELDEEKTYEILKDFQDFETFITKRLRDLLKEHFNNDFDVRKVACYITTACAENCLSNNSEYLLDIYR
ncbi:MAG: hypothetical protein WBA74_16105, partial [Cyclobacteriaceae bacterium]